MKIIQCGQIVFCSFFLFNSLSHLKYKSLVSMYKNKKKNDLNDGSYRTATTFQRSRKYAPKRNSTTVMNNAFKHGQNCSPSIEIS